MDVLDCWLSLKIKTEIMCFSLTSYSVFCGLSCLLFYLVPLLGFIKCWLFFFMVISNEGWNQWLSNLNVYSSHLGTQLSRFLVPFTKILLSNSWIRHINQYLRLSWCWLFDDSPWNLGNCCDSVKVNIHPTLENMNVMADHRTLQLHLLCEIGGRFPFPPHTLAEIRVTSWDMSLSFCFKEGIFLQREFWLVLSCSCPHPHWDCLWTAVIFISKFTL